ncbi:MAG: T9SS type A sorting domain-containing protein [Candidatus Zixiibacteriota bacterium]
MCAWELIERSFGHLSPTETELSDYNGNLLTVTKDVQPILPKTFALHQNYPNPFNATTRIIYEVPKTAHVKIEVFNIMGQKVTTLIDREESVGVHAIEWNGLDQSGNAVASGVYLYRLTCDDYGSEKKMVLLK